MFELIFLIFASLYFIQSVLFIIGIKRKFPQLKDEKLPYASVIVAARNEEENIIRCLNALDKLNYPQDKLEIILVDDNSTDRTGELIDNFIKNKNRFKKIVTRREIGKLKGKTNALANAIESAKGEIILTTDADCAVDPEWARSIASYYQDDIAIVNGFTNQEADNGFSGIQALDFIYLLIVAAGTINFGKAISCIGNNMSFRKKAYDEVGGYESLPFSVTEDSNLLHAIDRLGKYKIVYPLDKGALVNSIPCPDLKSLYRQKKRWAVGGLQVPFTGFVLMLTAFVTNLCILLTPVFYSPVWLYLVVFKLIVDFLVLYPVHNYLGIKKNLKYFILFQIYYIIYVICLPFIVLFSRRVIWKGRKF
jgi:cellulose synthase/poly-beta-1,6-N-acetylglucosamine synthase-like glycosyltransferase